MYQWLIAAAALVSSPTLAAGVPPTIDVPDVTCSEASSPCNVTILKTKSNTYSQVRIQTVDGTAKAGVDYNPVNVTITLGNNTTSYRLPVTILNNSTYQGQRQFALKVTIIRWGQLKGSFTPPTATINDDELPPPPPVSCPDGSTVPAGSSCPTGGLAGEAAIDDNFSYSDIIEPTQYGPIDNRGGTPPLGNINDLGAFRFTAQPKASSLKKDDPIVYPGQPGKSHLHLFICNDHADAYSTYQSLRTIGGSNCDNRNNGTIAANRSAYWTPAMMDGIGNAVLPDFVQVYYKQFAFGSPGCVGPMAIGICVNLPNGLRFIFGYNMKTMTGGPTGEGTRDYWSMSYSCEPSPSVPNPTSMGVHYHTIADVAKAGCPVGAYLTVKLDAPDCWDGRNLDTADHRSHMVYAPDGTDKGMGYVCPATHPYAIPLISYFWYYTVDANFVAGKWHLSSDEMMPGVAAGTTLHMDYFEAWSPKAKAVWQANCINRPASCSSGDMGDGTALKDAGEPAAGWLVHQLVPLSSIP